MLYVMYQANKALVNTYCICVYFVISIYKMFHTPAAYVHQNERSCKNISTSTLALAQSILCIVVWNHYIHYGKYWGPH